MRAVMSTSNAPNPSRRAVNAFGIAFALSLLCAPAFANEAAGPSINAFDLRDRISGASNFRAPAGTLPTTRDIFIDGMRAAVLPNGRFITPAGVEVNVDAPKPFGLALSPDNDTLAT